MLPRLNRFPSIHPIIGESNVLTFTENETVLFDIKETHLFCVCVVVGNISVMYSIEQARSTRGSRVTSCLLEKMRRHIK